MNPYTSEQEEDERDGPSMNTEVTGVLLRVDGTGTSKGVAAELAQLKLVAVCAAPCGGEPPKAIKHARHEA